MVVGRCRDCVGSSTVLRIVLGLEYRVTDLGNTAPCSGAGLWTAPCAGASSWANTASCTGAGV